MAGTVSVKVKGGEELARKLKALSVDVQAVLSEAVRAGAEVVRESAASRAPGPHIEIDEKEKKAQAVTYEIGPDEEHWYYRFFETGATEHEIKGSPLVFEGAAGLVITAYVQHPGLVAEPFLRPAIDEEGERAAAAVGAEIKKTIDRLCER